MANAAIRYVVLPNDNVFNANTETSSRSLMRSFSVRSARGMMSVSLSRRAGEEGPQEPQLDLKVLDTVDLNEGALVEMTREEAARLAHSYPSLRIAREVVLYPMRADASRLVTKLAKLPKFTSAKQLVVRCIDATSRKTVAGVELVIILNRKTRTGLTKIRTDANGEFKALLSAGQSKIDAVIAVPLADHWPVEVTGPISVMTSGETVVDLALPPLVAGVTDAVDHCLSIAPDGDGKGVKIAVIDTGTAAAPGINIKAGLNTTGSEPEELFTDNGAGHGTHVAGIISRIAPAAEIHVYRVFAESEEGASEIAIAKAVRHATDANCDLINLSLGQDTEPLTLVRATRRARAMGALCVGAAGNDGGPVSFPARSSQMMAVSALGIDGTWPDAASTGSAIASEPAPVAPYFFAEFSNRGESIDLIGPGVGIISWVTATQRGVMDGTSMACPAVTGLLARMLSTDSDLLAAERDQVRSDEIVKLAFKAARSVGFGLEFEGGGLIQRETKIA